MASQDSTARYKDFPPIRHVIAFDAEGSGPLSQLASPEPLIRLNVMAALTPLRTYPRSRISIGSALGCYSLTVQQASALKAQLEEAISDVVASCPDLETADDDCVVLESPTPEDSTDG